MNFLGLAPPDSARWRFVVLPVSYERTVSWGKGTARGPGALLDASANLELYDEELQVETSRVGIGTLPVVESEEPPDAFLPELEASYLQAMDRDRIVAMVGGEHSITLAGVRACHRRHTDLSVLQLDAHADLRDEYEGRRLSHATVMRRVSEICPVAQVGIRSLSAEEAEGVVGKRPSLFTHFLHEGWSSDLAERVCEELTDTVYLTFDLDVLDPALLPATGTPEPGGLGWNQAVSFLRSVLSRKRVVGFDVVELAPIEGMHASQFVAAKLTYRIMGYISRQRGWA